jgi:hypothetical protein
MMKRGSQNVLPSSSPRDKPLSDRSPGLTSMKPIGAPHPEGNSQGPGSFDGSHISPEIRARLSDLTPELAAGVRRVADTK